MQTAHDKLIELGWQLKQGDETGVSYSKETKPDIHEFIATIIIDKINKDFSAEYYLKSRDGEVMQLCWLPINLELSKVLTQYLEELE